MSFLATWLPFGQVRASAGARAAAKASARIDVLGSASEAPTLISGGKQTRGALPVETPIFDGAIYCSRGRGYAPYNEDAGGLFCDAKGRAFTFVLDQAGGLGGRVRGVASAKVAEQLFEAAKTIATAGENGNPDQPALVIREAFEKAHKLLLSRGEGEVTTAVMAMISADRALLVNSGDSGAMHFSGAGVLRAHTEMHEHVGANQGCLTHAIGLEPEGSEPENYLWFTEAGDWIVLASDGLLDAGLDDHELGRMLASSEGAEDAVNRIATTVLRRMGTFRAKPDNLTLVAVRVKGR